MSLKFQISFINEDSNEKEELRTNPWLVGCFAERTRVSNWSTSELGKHCKYLSVGSTLGSGLLAPSTANSDTVDHITLLGLIPKATGLVGARRTRSTVDNIEGTEFPAADTEKEAENVTLLLLLNFLDVLESSHFAAVVGGFSVMLFFEGR